jgi:hypothetical protein
MGLHKLKIANTTVINGIGTAIVGLCPIFISDGGQVNTL